MPRPRPPERRANPPECTARANRSVRRLIVDRRASHNRFPLRIPLRAPGRRSRAATAPRGTSTTTRTTHSTCLKAIVHFVCGEERFRASKQHPPPDPPHRLCRNPMPDSRTTVATSGRRHHRSRALLRLLGGMATGGPATRNAALLAFFVLGPIPSAVYLARRARDRPALVGAPGT